jgi:GAF domain-containing protein
VADPRQLYPDQTPEGGAPLAGPDPVYLENPVLDATVRMLVELAAQVWIERERRLALETLLAERGVLAAEAIEKFRPDAAQAAAFKAERARFIEDVFKELRRIPVAPAA